MSVDGSRLATSGNPRANNNTDSDLEAWQAKHNKNGSSASAVITKRLVQEIFHLASNMGWNAMLHKTCAFQEVSISQARNDAIL